MSIVVNKVLRSMTNNIYQVAKMMQRQGKKDELPYQLDSGEFGFATDTLELFIGVGDNPKFENRVNSKIYPYGNLRILTELSEPLEIQKYTYEGNIPIHAMFPIIFKGNVLNPTIEAGTSVQINDTTITFNDVATVDDIVQRINNTAIPYTNAYSVNGYLTIVSTDNDLKIKNIEKNFIQATGLTDDMEKTEIGEAAKDCVETTLQAVLDEYLTVKHYDVKGDGVTDDTSNINNALLGTYCVSNAPAYLRTLYFPADVYSVSEQINIPSNARMLGEGKGRSVIKASISYENMIGFLDQNKKPSDAIDFGGENINPYNITVEGFTFDGDGKVANIMTVSNGSNITFRDCEFKNCSENGIFVKGNNLHITFDSCDFENCGSGINTSYENSNIEHLSILNCHFKDINEEAIIISSLCHKAMMINNCFMDCASFADQVIKIDGERAVLVQSTFDDNIEQFDTTPVPYACSNNTLYTDILNPSTANQDMVYKFDFPQPKWGYIDSLRNSRGEYILKPVYDNVNEEIKNWVYIRPGVSNDEKVEIYTEDKFKDVYFGAGQYANIIIGDCSNRYASWTSNSDYEINDYVEYDNKLYKCLENHHSESYSELSNTSLWEEVLSLNNIMIKLGKNLDLDGHYITNPEDRDIIFKPQGDAVLHIEDESYNEKIEHKTNAVATVGYVKKRISNKSLTFSIDMKDYSPSTTWNLFELATLYETSYSETIYIKNVSVSVENIFRKYDFENMMEWESEKEYYKGQGVKHNGYYYVAKEENHSMNWVDAFWEQIEINGYNPETIRIYALQSGMEIDLVPTNTIKLYEAEDKFPNETSYLSDTVVGNVYNYHYSRNTNVSDYTIIAEITDEDGNTATNFQPSGKLFITVDLIVE